DTDPTVLDTGTRSCYSGPANTMGIGTCKAGQQTCAQGVWNACIGEIVPTGEACNNEDDDCNGVVDDGLPSFNCGIGKCALTQPSCVNGVVQPCVPGLPV